MSAMSRCNSRKSSQPTLPLRSVVFVFFMLALVAGFSIAQLRLQFALDDLRQETVRLQGRKMKLRGEVNLLRNEVESRKQGDRLLDYARSDLGMVRYTTAQVTHISVDPELRERYESFDVAMSDPAGSPKADRKGGWLQAAAAGMGLTGRAYAEDIQAGGVERIAPAR